MKVRARYLSRQLLALLLCASVAFGQTTAPAPDQPVFTQQELDQMLAPIALYPDSLLSQILMASTYPIEIVKAARWSRAHRSLAGNQAVTAAEQEEWDPSVKSLVAFPQVLAMMDEKLDWTQRLGDAFLSQREQVMDTVQDLRQKALAAGNLKSDEKVRVESTAQTIVVEQASPQVVYVPYYDPYVVYGPWWWPGYPPVYWGPWPGYYAYPGPSPGFWWGVGITVGVGFFFGAFDWPHHHVTIVNAYPHYYRPPARVPIATPGHWQHDPDHRRGVPYRDPVLRQEFGRRDARPEARREFRGNEPYRPQGAGDAGVRPDTRDGRGSRTEPREPTRPGTEGNVRPNPTDAGRPEPRSIPNRPNVGATPGRSTVPDVGRPEPRSTPARPSVDTVPGRTNVPDVGRPETRSAPNRPNVDTAPTRPAIPDVGQPERRSMPSRPSAPVAATRPGVEPRPHVFEGVGQGPVVRDSSVRGHSSSQVLVPGSGGGAPSRPPGNISAPRQGGNAAPQQRPSGGVRGNEGQPRQQQR